MQNNIVGIVQCRMGATRLPNKMMLPLKGIPVIEWVFRRVKKAKRLDRIMIAMPDTPENGILEAYVRSLGAEVFRGSEENVVDRFYRAALLSKASHVVRICADNPFIDPDAIDDLVDFYFQNRCDYAYNHIPRDNTYPDGLGAEIVSFKIFEQIHQEARQPSQREHIFNYIWDNPQTFSIKTFDPKNEELAHPELKLDLDTVENYRRMEPLPVNVDMPSLKIVKMFLETQ